MAKKIIAFSGSSRKDSFNKKALAIAVDAARQAGLDVTVVDLKDYPLPIYNGDLEAEEGIPAKALALKKMFIDSDGFLIASPEYNSAFSPLLKNTIDWVSRAETDEEEPLIAFKGRTAAILAASPGGYGGSRGLKALRTLLENIRVTVIPEEATIPKAHEVFNADGSLNDPALAEKIRAVGQALSTHLAASVS